MKNTNLNNIDELEFLLIDYMYIDIYFLSFMLIFIFVFYF